MTSSSLVQFFTQDHHNCDELWITVEAAGEANDLELLKEAALKFDQALRHHFSMEEEVLFPAFEEASGMTSGPTQVMRMEHTQMRNLLDQMEEARTRSDSQELLDLGDTLLMFIAQHNNKEEGMLYPMAERALGGQWESLRQRLHPSV
jgi:hemerythrin-like domain-containing protein